MTDTQKKPTSTYVPYSEEIIIKPKTGWFDIDLAELWRYRDLIVMFVKRNFTVQFKQTILGPLWLIINPLMTSVVFTFVFGNFAGIPTDGVPTMLFYMAGNTMWGLFASALTGTSNTFTANAGVFGKIYFPRLTAPISQVITSLVNFGIQFAMLMIFFVYFASRGEVALSWWALLIPALLLHTVVLGLGVGIIISSVTTKYRDLAIAVGFGVQLWMYATPVVYPLSQTGSWMRTLLLINPMTSIINNFRFALLGCGQLMTGWWAVSAVITLILLALGVILFSRIEKTFMDTV